MSTTDKPIKFTFNLHVAVTPFHVSPGGHDVTKKATHVCLICSRNEHRDGT